MLTSNNKNNINNNYNNSINLKSDVLGRTQINESGAY